MKLEKTMRAVANQPILPLRSQTVTAATLLTIPDIVPKSQDLFLILDLRLRPLATFQSLCSGVAKRKECARSLFCFALIASFVCSFFTRRSKGSED